MMDIESAIWSIAKATQPVTLDLSNKFISFRHQIGDEGAKALAAAIEKAYKSNPIQYPENVIKKCKIN